MFTQNDLENVQDLFYKINVSACSLRLENQSPYALDIFKETEHLERVNPYSYIILPNEELTVKVNKTIKGDNKQPYSFVSFKKIYKEVKNEQGATTFTGTINANITNSKIDANITNSDINANILNSNLDVNITNATLQTEIIGDVQATITNSEIQATITNPNIDVNITNSVVNTKTEVTNEVQATITNASIPVTGNLNANITNANIPVSGTVEANITNAVLNTQTNITNQSLAIKNEAGGSLTVAGAVNIANTPQVTVAGTTNVNINNTPNVNISNANIPVSGNVNATITNASIPITGNVGITSGTINANIQNAQLNTQLMNAMLGTNEMVQLTTGSYTTLSANESVTIDGTFNLAYFDKFIFMVNYSAPATTNFQNYYTVNTSVNNAALLQTPTETPLTLLRQGTSKPFSNSKDFSMAAVFSLGKAEPVTYVVSMLNPVNNPPAGMKVTYTLFGYLDKKQSVGVKIENVTDFSKTMKGVDFVGGDANTLTEAGWYSGYNLVNTPYTSGLILHFRYRGGADNNYATQFFHSVTGTSRIWTRRKVSGAWETWTEIKNENTIQRGSTTVTITNANTTYSQAVTFSTPFASTPSITATPVTSDPVACKVSIGNRTANGFTIYAQRNAASTTVQVDWIATN